MLAVGAPAANAADVLAPSSFDFGNQNVGTPTPKDDTPTFVIQATCDAFNFPPVACISPPSGVHSYGAITVAGPGFAIVPDTDVCNARGGVLVTPSSSQPVDACTLQVTFKPTSGGVKTGKLTTTSSPPSPSNPTGAPLTATLKGTGIVTGNPGTTAKKKCKKKKRSASAAKKKCKKKK
jgi:hypothetical protein